MASIIEEGLEPGGLNASAPLREDSPYGVNSFRLDQGMGLGLEETRFREGGLAICLAVGVHTRVKSGPRYRLGGRPAGPPRSAGDERPDWNAREACGQG